MSEISFANPEYFFFLILLPVVWTWRYFMKQSWDPAIQHAGLSEPIKDVFGMFLSGLRFLPYLAFLLLVISLARPQKAFSEEKIKTEGIDIVLSLDVSSSMLAKKVAKDFIDNRSNDRMGMVVFAGESFTQCPITTDHKILKKQIDEVKNGVIEDGTAIGMGLGTAVNRLKESEAKSKVIILMTDGVNNSGYIDPVTAIDLAINEDIRVYTIGLGTIGEAPYPARDMFGRTVLRNMEVEIDEALLEEIADKTGGVYYRATDNSSLNKIYKEIDLLEKSKIELSSFERKTELFRPWALGSLGILICSFVLNQLFIRENF
jgi:Ca-activated chloride channel family protein